MVPDNGLLHLYFNPEGRINRSTYWLKGVLLHTAIWIVLWVALKLVAGANFNAWLNGLIDDLFAFDFGAIPDAFNYLITYLGVYFLALVVMTIVYWWTSIAIMVKRLHDRDKSGWWILLWAMIFVVGAFVIVGPLIVLIWALIELGFLEGTLGRNRYGDDPNGQISQRDSAYSRHGSPAVDQFLSSSPSRSGNTIATQSGERMKRCPFCAEVIRYSAVRCRHCQADLPTTADRPTTATVSGHSRLYGTRTQTTEYQTRACPNCGKQIGRTVTVCLYCGVNPDTGTASG